MLCLIVCIFGTKWIDGRVASLFARVCNLLGIITSIGESEAVMFVLTLCASTHTKSLTTVQQPHFFDFTDFSGHLWCLK